MPRPPLVYRDFTHVGAGKMPGAKTMGRWGDALGPSVIKEVHDQVVQIALARRVVQGRKMRIDTTVVESNIHYPTDSGRLGDGVRVLTRSMRKITELTGAVGAKLRDRSRSVKWRVLEIARAARGKAPPSREKLKAAYGSLLRATGRVVGQAKRFSREIGEGVKRSAEIVQQTAMEGHRRVIDVMVPLVQQVIRQTKARIFRGDPRSKGKIVSLFEPSTEVIRKGKAAKPTEFGKLVKLQEAENQIVIDYEVYAQRPNDSDLLMPAIEAHAAKLGRIPRLVAADAGFYSTRNEAAAKAKGVKRVCIPNRGSKSAARKPEQKERWFRNGQRWRTGCEGRISARKRRTVSSGADIAATMECRPRVIADNLINIGRTIAAQSAT